MNFYTLISKSNKQPKMWLFLTISTTFFISFFIIGFNFIIDPYNVTAYNILNIQNKFVRDDRAEKITQIKTLGKVDNIMIGSSRVYTMNPDVVSSILGGTTYNFGVGSATIEDHLGIIKYLKREQKLPKNLIIGVDFYTFNPQIPPNKYFLTNKDLNFLSFENYEEDYISKLFSIDSLRASFKTLKNHIKDKNKKSKFNHLGWWEVGALEKDSIKTKKEIEENIENFYSNLNYSSIDTKRVEYYEAIRQICKENDINIYIFTTPLHPSLLKVLKTNQNTKKALQELINYLSTFEYFVNLYENEEISNNVKNFKDTTHTTSLAGNLILKTVLENKSKP